MHSVLAAADTVLPCQHALGISAHLVKQLSCATPSRSTSGSPMHAGTPSMTAAARDSSDHTAYSMAYSRPHANMPATCCLHDGHRMTQGVSFCAWKLHLAASVLPDPPSAGYPHRPCKLTGQVPVSDKGRALTAAHREAVLTFRHCATHCFRACIDSVRMHNVGGGPTPTAGPMISGTRQRQYRDQRMRSGA